MSVAVGSHQYGLSLGQPGLKSVGALTFGPDGILFVADNVRATIFAVDVDDQDGPRPSHRQGSGDVIPSSINVEQLDVRLAAYLGCSEADVAIRDLAVHPTSENVYLAVMRGTGIDAIPLLIKVSADGSLAEVSLEQIPFSETAISNAPSPADERTVSHPSPDGRIARDPLRTATVTDMAYLDGELLVAGTSNEEFSSTFRRIPFPFDRAQASGDAIPSSMSSNSLEIFHVSHGRYETASPIRAFLPYRGASSVLASYACTPVVHFSMEGAAPGSHVMGRTVAELGAGNFPIDIVSYERDNQQFLLVSNTKHPLIKIACADIDRQEGLTEPKEPVGVPRESLPHPGVTHMANLGDGQVLMMQKDEAQHVHLRSYASASL